MEFIKMLVNEWKPNKDCERCEEARKIMDSMTKKQMEYHSLVLTKLKDKSVRIEELETYIDRLENELIDIQRINR